MVKEGLILSVLMLFYSLFKITGYLFLDIEAKDLTFINTAPFLLLSLLIIVMPPGNDKTNLYWRLLGLSIGLFVISDIGNTFISYPALGARFFIEAIAIFGFFFNYKESRKTV